MSGICRYWPEFLLMAKQLLLAHEPQNALMVDRVAAILKFCCDPPVSVIRKLQSYFLDLVNQIRGFAILSRNLFGPLQPFIVAAATYIERQAGVRYWQQKIL